MAEPVWAAMPERGERSNLVGTTLLAVCVLGVTAVAAYTANRERNKATSNSGNSKSIVDTRHTSSSNHNTRQGDVAHSASNKRSSNNNGSSKQRDGSAAAATRGSNGSASGRVSAAQLPSATQYYALSAQAHVRRYGVHLVEWYDDVLGVCIPFSPILFAVTHEQRQTPLILLTLSYLRQEVHRVTITIEQLAHALRADEYRDANLHKIDGCADVLSSANTRVGNTLCPSIEYCYANEAHEHTYALAVFVTHACLAVTVQYAAPTRVRHLLPTAFYELVRAIRFRSTGGSNSSTTSSTRHSSAAAAAATPSYLLLCEPRVGLGYRLELDRFAVCDTPPPPLQPLPCIVPQQPQQQADVYVDADDGGSRRDEDVVTYAASVPPTPFALAQSRGTERMSVVACYEPPPPQQQDDALPDVAATATAAASTSRSVASRRAMHAYVEQRVRAALVHLRLASSAAVAATRIAFVDHNDHSHTHTKSSNNNNDDDDDDDDDDRAGCLVVRSFTFTRRLHGDFARDDDDDDDDKANSSSSDHGKSDDAAAAAAVLHARASSSSSNGSHRRGNGTAASASASRTTTSSSAALTAFVCMTRVCVQRGSVCWRSVHDALDQAGTTSSSGGSSDADDDDSHVTAGARHVDNNNDKRAVPVYYAMFVLPVGDACVSLHFAVAEARHAFDDLVHLCTSTMRSISLGNHRGQHATVWYCNMRHDVLPFTLSLASAHDDDDNDDSNSKDNDDDVCDVGCTVCVDEPVLGDPLAVLYDAALAATAYARASRNNDDGRRRRRDAGSDGGRCAYVVLRALPLLYDAMALRQRTRARATAASSRTQRGVLRVLEYSMRMYLGELAGDVQLLHYHAYMHQAAPTVAVCFRATATHTLANVKTNTHDHDATMMTATAAAAAAAAAAGGATSPVVERVVHDVHCTCYACRGATTATTITAAATTSHAAASPSTLSLQSEWPSSSTAAATLEAYGVGNPLACCFTPPPAVGVFVPAAAAAAAASSSACDDNATTAAATRPTHAHETHNYFACRSGVATVVSPSVSTTAAAAASAAGVCATIDEASDDGGDENDNSDDDVMVAVAVMTDSSDAHAFLLLAHTTLDAYDAARRRLQTLSAQLHTLPRTSRNS